MKICLNMAFSYDSESGLLGFMEYLPTAPVPTAPVPTVYLDTYDLWERGFSAMSCIHSTCSRIDCRNYLFFNF